MSKKSTQRLSQIIHRFISFKNNHGNNNALQSFQSSKAGSASPEEKGGDTESAPNGQAGHPIFVTDRSQIIFVKNNQAKTIHYIASSSPSANLQKPGESRVFYVNQPGGAKPARPSLLVKILPPAITKAAVDDLSLTAGDTAYAVIKPSDVITGK